jgi:hypothetical protein
MPLTASECRIAAERAKEYPCDKGKVYIPLNPDPEELRRVVGDPRTDLLFGNAIYTAIWLKAHPEDVGKG